MNRVTLQNGIVFLQFQAVGCILLILLGDVSRCSGHARFLVLCALHDDLNAIAFLCHTSLL